MKRFYASIDPRIESIAPLPLRAHTHTPRLVNSFPLNKYYTTTDVQMNKLKAKLQRLSEFTSFRGRLCSSRCCCILFLSVFVCHKERKVTLCVSNIIGPRRFSYISYTNMIYDFFRFHTVNLNLYSLVVNFIPLLIQICGQQKINFNIQLLLLLCLRVIVSVYILYNSLIV